MTDSNRSLVDRFFSQHRTQHFRSGEVLLQAETIPNGVFFLKSGVVNLVSVSPKGEEVVLNVFKPGSFFPVQAVLAQEEWQSQFVFQALEDTEVQKAPIPETRTFLHENPEVVYDLLSRIYRGIDGLFLRLSHLMAGTARERIIQEMLIRAKRFGEQHDDHISFELSEKELAALAGVTRETVSRVFSDLRSEGLMEYAQQTVKILDFDRLEKEV